MRCGLLSHTTRCCQSHSAPFCSTLRSSQCLQSRDDGGVDKCAPLKTRGPSTTTSNCPLLLTLSTPKSTLRWTNLRCNCAFPHQILFHQPLLSENVPRGDGHESQQNHHTHRCVETEEKEIRRRNRGASILVNVRTGAVEECDPYAQVTLRSD